MAISTNQIIGILLIVLGVVLLANWLSIPYLSTIIAILLIVVGVMALIGTRQIPKNLILGVILIVLAVILLVSPWGVAGRVSAIVETIIAILLIVGGILKLLGKW